MSEELKNQGNAAAKAGDFNSAIQFYSQAIGIDPDNHILYSNRSNIYMQMGNYNAALEDGERCIQLNPKFGKGYVRKADALLKLNKNAEAAEILREGEQQDPNEPMIKQRLTQVSANQINDMMANTFGRSEQELRMKMMSKPKINQMMMQDPSLFARVNAVRTNPNGMAAMGQDQAVMAVMIELMGLGDMMKNQPQEQGQQDNQQQNYEHQTPVTKPSYQETKKPETKQETKQVSSEEEQANKLKNEGNELFKQQKYEEAIKKYEEAFQVHKNITYLNNISTCLIKMEQYENALVKAEEAYNYGKENIGSASFQEIAKALFRQGSALHKLGRFEEAIQKLNDSMVESRDKQTLNLLNMVKKEQEEKKKKDQYDVNAANLSKEQGNQLYKEKKYIEAAEKFSEGLKYLPIDMLNEEGKTAYVNILNNRSMSLFKAGQIHASYEDCMKILQNDFNPTHVKALLRKAQIERIRKQYYLSIETYNKVFTIDQTNSEALDGYQKTQAKIQAMQSGQMTETEIKEIADIAMADENIQNMLKDPGLSQVLQQIQQDPVKAQQLMADPNISMRIQKLINAGVLRVGGH